MAKLISTLPVGSKIKFGKHQVNTEAKEDIIWQIGAKNHNGYPSDSITLVADKIIDYRGFDAMEPSNSDTNRRTRGNNRYKDSNLRQWLNKAGNPWFVKTHTEDEPPTNAGTNNYGTDYDTRDGFLSAFTADELAAILNTNVITAKNTVTDGGGLETVIDKVFLLSNTEVGLANEPGGAEGFKLAMFTDDASRISKTTQQAFTNTKNTNKQASINDPWHWWLRSPYSGNSYYVRHVNTSGALDNHNACNGTSGVRPALNLSSEILVSDTTDVDGCYEAVWTNVISNDLQKINNTDFTWNVGLIGEHTNVKSQLHIYNNSNVLVAQGVVKSGIGIQTDTIIPAASGTFKAKVKLWSDVTAENWSNQITYIVTVIPYTLTLDKVINIAEGESLEQVKFKAKVNNKNLALKSMDNEKIVFEGNALNTTEAELEIEGTNATIDKIAYVIN